MTSKAEEKYTVEFKENAVKRRNESENVSETRLRAGVKPNTKFSQRTTLDKTERSDKHLYDELKQLRKENARLKEQRDILKKMSAYFARETRFRPDEFFSSTAQSINVCRAVSDHAWARGANT